MISSVYSPVAQFVSTTSTSTSASERNGRAIRRSFKRGPKAVREKQAVMAGRWEVDECTIMLRGSDGSIREVSGYVVRRGKVVKRFVNREGVERFLSQN